jgi:hypothetical protein
MIARLILCGAIVLGLSGWAVAHAPVAGHVQTTVPIGVWLSPPHSTGFWDSWTRPPRPPAAGCFVRGALWALGRPATSIIVARARTGAAARFVQVVRPGEAVAIQFNPHRLTVAVDERNIIRGVRCG